jgi:hypothetical protein
VAPVKTRLSRSGYMRDSPAFNALMSFRFKWVIAAVLVLLIDLLVNLALFAARPGLFLRLTPEPDEWSAAPLSAGSLTSTPYQPLTLTPTRHPAEGPALPEGAVMPEGNVLPVTSTPIPGPSHDFYSIDFHPGAAGIKLMLKPPTGQVNRGRPIVITVNPGRSCPYEADRACVTAFRSSAGGNVIFISVHSGIEGEAETYRRAVEGLGVDQAGYSLKQIRLNLAGLAGAAVQIKQGERVIGGLRLAAAGRVPARLIQEYFHSPVEQALGVAASANPELESLVNAAGPILVFETCGWTVPGEAWAPGVTSASSSVYIGVIQLAP